MEAIRKPGQGVYNIVRFNWHFYALILLLLVALATIYLFVPASLKFLVLVVSVLAFLSTVVSLLVSWYVYDLSSFYSLKWIEDTGFQNIANIHAGFDETSELLKRKFPQANLQVFDFYDPFKHTEVSIKRARKAYSAFPGTKVITTGKVPAQDSSTGIVFLTLAAHEFRNDEERILFFKELSRILEKNGKIFVTEHLRDLPNFLAYNIGFFHFLPKVTWERTFSRSGFCVTKKTKVTPFINVFILEKNGAAS
jgi:hypothetical protein